MDMPPPVLPVEEIVSRFPNHWVLVVETAWDRQASIVSPFFFEAIYRMIGCLENSLMLTEFVVIASDLP